MNKNNKVKRIFTCVFATLISMSSVNYISKELNSSIIANATGEVFTISVDTSKRSFAWPVPESNKFSACFTDGRNHGAIDIPAPLGTPIEASYAGTVVQTGFQEGGAGNYVAIEHHIAGKTYYTVYMHMSKIEISQGAHVEQGTRIGQVGSTGDSSGNHLDFSIREGNLWNGKKLDPGLYTRLPSTLVFWDTCPVTSKSCCNSYLTDLQTNPGVILEEIYPSKPTLTVNTNTASDRVTFSWNACSNADRYDLRVYVEGTSGGSNFIYQQTTDTSLTYTLPEGKWWANVVAVNNTANDHETYGWSEENHFAVTFGYPEPKAMTNYNGHIYALYEATTYYDQAREICKKMGGHLATITSAEENKAVASLMTNAEDIGYWMGASDEKNEETWVWETGETFGYDNWDKSSKEPNNADGVEHYLMMYPSGLWNDARSFGIYHYGFILEIEPQKAAKTEEYNGSIYTRFDSTLNWLEAEEYCKSLGGHLVTINDKSENDFVKSMISDGKQSSYWIGLYDSKKKTDSHDYRWSSGEETDFTSWNQKDDGTYQPDCWAGVEFYGEMYKSSGNWNDMSSYGLGERGFVCEVKKNIKSIALVSLPYKTEYNPGEKLDLRGMSLKVTYDKGEDAVITEGFEASADLSEIGKKTVTVTYDGKKFTFDVNVAYAKLNARLTSKSEKRLTLTWTMEKDATRYEVLLNGEVADEESTDNKCTLVNLTPNTNYKIQVIAYSGTSKLTESDILYINTNNKEMGDVNQDGSVEVTDIVNLQKYLHHSNSMSAPSLDVADMNFDGEIDVFDLGLLKQVLLGEWTPWSPEAPPEDAKEVETRTEYRYAEKTYQESSEELPEPWVLDNKETVYSDFGAWSDWQEGEVVASDNREVETKTESRSEITGYHMFYFCTRRDSTEFIRSYRNFSINGEFSKYGAYERYGEHDSIIDCGDVTATVDELNNATVVAPGAWHSGSQSGYNECEAEGYVLSGDPHLFFKGNPITNNYDITLYRYHDRIASTKYTYYKPSEFSQWSETKIDEKDGIIVETRTLYRYKK